MQAHPASATRIPLGARVRETGHRGANPSGSPHAFVPALVSSGLPCDKFCFEGFLPQKKGRQTRLETLKDEPRSIVFYESPRRLVKTLQQFCEVFGKERQVSVAREISKLHEQHVRGTLQEVLTHFEKTEPLGEIVIILAGNTPKDDNVNCQLSTVNSQLSTVNSQLLMGTGKKKNKYK